MIRITDASHHDEIQGAIELTIEAGDACGVAIVCYDEGADAWTPNWSDSLDQWLDEALHGLDLDELVALCDQYIERHRSVLLD